MFVVSGVDCVSSPTHRKLRRAIEKSATRVDEFATGWKMLDFDC